MIDILNESGAQVDEQALLDLSVFALDALRIHPQADLSIAIVDTATMTTLHERYLDLPGPTDVMSFPMEDLLDSDADVEDDAPPQQLGDIALCAEVIAEQAPQNGRTADEEAQYLLIHGLLHLLGYDHAEPAEKAVMFALNDKILAEWAAQRDERPARLP